MGWTFYNVYEVNGKVDRKAECDKILTWNEDRSAGKVIKSAMRGSVYYAALEHTDKINNKVEVVGAVILTSSDKAHGCNFGYKDMSESMGPGYYDCPLNIINLLSDTDNEYALAWRKKCIENAHKKKTSWLKNVKIGDYIVYRRHDGKEVILMKHEPAYQFKTWFWFNPATNQYIKKTMINENNSRLYIPA